MTEFNEFRDTLFNNKRVSHKMKIIQSKNHKPRTYEINKVLLSVFDNKRFVVINDVFILFLIFIKI